MKKLTSLLTICIAATLMFSCGVDREETNVLGAPTPLAGAWRIVMVPFPDPAGCPANLTGFAIQSPIDVPSVSQSGYNLAASFDIGGSSVLLTGVAAFSGANFVIEEVGVFMESFVGALVGGGLIGSFKGQELPTGCEESGLFVAAIGNTDAPAVAGTWTINITGTATECDDPNDLGAFAKTIPGVTTNSPATYMVGGTYEDPATVFNVVAGVAMGTSFAAGIVDPVNPPTRTATLLGVIDTVSQVIAGTAEGTLAFAGGNCVVDGATFAIQY